MYRICKYCGEEAAVKNGKKHGVQNWLCRACGRAWTKEASARRAEEELMAVALYSMPLSFRTISKLMRYHHKTISTMIQRFKDRFGGEMPSREEYFDAEKVRAFLEERLENCTFEPRIVIQLKRALKSLNQMLKPVVISD